MRLRLAKMPSTLDSLRSEHALLRKAIVVLERMAAHLAAGHPFPGADCAVVLRFLREFIGGVHMRKESEVVFPAVAMFAGDAAAEQVGQLLMAQEEATELLHSLVLFWEPVQELTGSERACFVEAVRAYCSHMERTLALEEHKAFALAEASVPADDRLAWQSEFAAIAAERPAAAALPALLLEVERRWR